MSPHVCFILVLILTHLYGKNAVYLAVVGDVFCGLFVMSVFLRGVFDEIWDSIESVSEGFPPFSYL